MDTIKEKRTPGYLNSEKDKLRETENTSENHNNIQNHLKAAVQYSNASKCHHDAAKYHEEGNHEKANEAALLAVGHAALANRYQMEDARYHALEKI